MNQRFTDLEIALRGKLASAGRLAAAAGLPHAVTGYRYVPVDSILDYAREQDGATVEEVYPVDLDYLPLPANVADISLLPTEHRKWRRSFADIPTRSRQAVSMVTMQDCRVLAAKGEWDLNHFALVSSDGQRLGMRGPWLPGHRRLRRSTPGEQRVDHAVWILGSWYLNYFHWLIQHVSKMFLLQQQGLLDQLIFGPDFDVPPAWSDSALRVGIDVASAPQMQGSVLSARKLTIVHAPHLNGAWLRDFRTAMTGPYAGPPKRKIFVSRKAARSRHLDNESAVWSMLERDGFELVVLEELSFAEQVELFSQALVIVSLHGAGLANIVFSAASAHIVEIIDPGFPNPEYYELASVLGHGYWLVSGTPTGAGKPGYRDLSVDVDELRLVIDQVDQHI